MFPGGNEVMKMRTVVLAVLTLSCVLPPVVAADAQPMKVQPVTMNLPDLTIDDLRLNPACLLEVKLRNKGTAAIGNEAFGEVVVKIKAGKKVKKYSLSSLGGCGGVKGAGGQAWCATPMKIKGSKSVQAEVDPKGKLAEVSNTNNSRTEDLTCGADDDGGEVPEKSRVPAPSPAGGMRKSPAPAMKVAPLKPMTMQAKVRKPQGGGEVPPEEGGGSAFGQAVLATPVVRNGQPRATEPVLTIFSSSITPASPPQGGTGTVSFTIRNTGGSASPGPTSFGLQVYSSDAQGNPDTGDFETVIPWYTNNIPVLDPGESHIISAPVTFLHAGPHTANGVIITEGYELGEVSTFKSPWKYSFQVAPRPDLVVCFKKTNHLSGSQSATFPPKVRNLGAAPSTPANLSFWIEGKGTENFTIPAVDPGDEYAGVQRTDYYTSGVRFSLVVDSNDDVDEVYEGNNVIEGWIQVGQYGSNSVTQCSDQPGMTGY